ncbi:MAG: hypothetical protein WAP23_01730 [Candidatus Spechtbacterales bacterium]
MKRAWRDFLVLLMRHPWVAGILGFFSIFFVWAIPAYLLNWNEWFSFAYLYGDHIVLPIFNALSFWLLAKNKFRIPLWKALVVVPGGILIAFFEPDASSFLEAGSVSSYLKLYHSTFVFLEFSFILFVMLYPFLRGTTYAPARVVLALVVLMGLFVMFVFIPDDRLHDIPLWQKVATVGLLAATYVAFIFHRKLGIPGKIKKAIFK